MKHLEELEVIDQAVLLIIGSHSKTPSEILYLETGTIPLRYIIMIRRILFFQTIVKISDNELTKKVFKA